MELRSKAVVFWRGGLVVEIMPPRDNWHPKSGDIFHLHHSGVEHRASGGPDLNTLDGGETLETYKKC